MSGLTNSGRGRTTISNWNSANNPRKANLVELWDYATKTGLVEDDGHPLALFDRSHKFLLVEKKSYKRDTTFWGTTHTDLPSARQYVFSSPFYGNGEWNDRGWRVAYLFDLDTALPMDPATIQPIRTS